MSFIRYRRGAAEFENVGEVGEGYQQGQSSPYASFPEPGDDQQFQSQPFGANSQQPVTTEYNVPSY